MYNVLNFFGSKFAACSKKAAEHLFNENNIKNNYNFIPNAVDFNIIINVNNEDLTQLKKSINLQPDSKIIGHIGRYGKAKNHEFIIDMFSELIEVDDSFCLLLIGDGPSRTLIENKVKTLGISENVKVLGLRNDVPQILNILDLFILPSLYEGLGIVLLEAQAAGLPCVVSENIQPEADMGLDLMHWVDLNNLSTWKSTITKNIDGKLKDKNKIRKVINDSPFVLSSVVNQFYKLYEL